MDNNVKPQIASISYDEFDAEGEQFFKGYEADRKNVELLNKAADSYSKSANPEGKKIAELLRGLYYRELGVNEVDNKKALKHLQKAVVFFGKAVGRNSIEAKKVRLELLKRKILAVEKKQKPPKDLFLKRAKLYQELKDMKNYHGDMSLYYMFSMMELEPFDDKIIKFAELMVEHAKQSEHQELFYKAKVLLHQIKSSLASEPRIALEELEESLNAIKQTSDKYGEEEAQARLAFTKGMLTTDKRKRQLLLAEATQRWDKLGNKKQAVRAAKMLLPVPINVSVILNLTDKALENHQLLNKRIHELITITPGPYALFHHHSHLIERIKDVKKIIKRLGENRKAITDLSIRENALRPVKVVPGKPYPKKLQVIMSKHHDLTEQMKLDMESLYVFGNLLLDQWAYMIGYLVGVNSPDSFNFHALYDEMSSNKDKELFSLLWDRHRRDIYWL